MILDIKTLVIVLIVISFISAFALFFFYKLLDQITGLKQAAIGGAFQALASCFCFFIIDTNNMTLVIMLTDISYFMSFVFYYQAARLLSGLRTSWVFPIGFVAVLIPLILVFRSHLYIDARVVVTLGGIATLLLLTSLVVLKSSAKLPSRLLLVMTFISSFLACLWIIANIVIEPEQINVASDLKPLQFAFLWLAGSSFLITLSFIMLTSEQLHQKLKLQVDMLGSARDIAHESLKQQRHFMSMLSHEFKGPIGAIQANADAIFYTQKDNSVSVLASIERIKSVSQRLSDLVDHCLNNEWLAHSIEHHNGPLEPLSLNQVIASVCDEFLVDFETITDSAVIDGEPIFLPVLFSNLVSNAVQHASDRTAVRVLLEENSTDYIVTISDDGTGITEAEQQHIFHRYYRGEGSNNSASGSGLGLYFVKRITDMHGGHVSVNCTKGTIFTVTFSKREAINA